MKRALKWTLILLGVPALAAGALAVDARRRALHVIETQEQRLQGEIAALRAKRRRSRLLEGRDLSGLDRLPCPSDSFAAGDVGIELGHTGQDSLKAMRVREALSLYQRATRHPTPLRPDELLTVFGVTERCFGEGGFRAYSWRHLFDTKALDSLGRLLVQPGVGVADLEQIRAALDALLAARPALEDVLQAEHLLDRAEVLRVYRARNDDYGMLQQAPGVPEGFSWRVLVVKALNQLDDRRAALFDAASPSLEEWGKKAGPLARQVNLEGAYTRSNLVTNAVSIIETERLALCHWRFVQVAAAVALFRAEKRREPGSLQDLVPEYFPELPVNAYDGKPFDYRDGTLRTPPSTSGPQFEWSLRRP